MSILFECEYQGERFAGFERPVAGEPLRLYPVKDGQVAAAVIATAGPADPAALIAAVRDGATEVTVPADAPALRFLPPLLPTASGNALLSGFMKTHIKKNGGSQMPADEEFDAPPPWFFKGFGSWLRMPGETLTVPSAAVALIEEPEIALVYVNDADGTPHYAGFTFGNDLCDIGLHRQNPAWNPYCKLCDTSMTPWLFLGEPPQTVNGRTTIERDGTTAWEGTFECGADSLYYRVQDMADRFFSYPAVRRPGLVNYVLLGADEASFHDGFQFAHGDRVTIDVKSHGVELSNVIVYDGRPAV